MVFEFKHRKRQFVLVKGKGNYVLLLVARSHHLLLLGGRIKDLQLVAVFCRRLKIKAVRRLFHKGGKFFFSRFGAVFYKL